MELFPQDLLEKDIKQARSELIRHFVNVRHKGIDESLDTADILIAFMIQHHVEMKGFNQEHTVKTPIGDIVLYVGERSNERKINIKPEPRRITAGFGE